jgi:hypothetical protein
MVFIELDVGYGHAQIVLDGKDNEAMISAYRNKYSDLPLSGGYYEQKTVR